MMFFMVVRRSASLGRGGPPRLLTLRSRIVCVSRAAAALCRSRRSCSFFTLLSHARLTDDADTPLMAAATRITSIVCESTPNTEARNLTRSRFKAARARTKLRSTNITGTESGTPFPRHRVLRATSAAPAMPPGPSKFASNWSPPSSDAASPDSLVLIKIPSSLTSSWHATVPCWTWQGPRLPPTTIQRAKGARGRPSVEQDSSGPAG